MLACGCAKGMRLDERSSRLKRAGRAIPYDPSVPVGVPLLLKASCRAVAAVMVRVPRMLHTRAADERT